ncbi:MAG: DUF3368 domain-containing protein [Chloroflexota bacterium]|nr:DUF3368 domain-containing protein [Chloroflexota bacterium]
MVDSPLYIVDANILIDLYVGGLIQECFSLPYRFVAPDVVIAELQEPDGHTLTTYGLQSAELSGEQVLEIMALRVRHLALSAEDLFALVLARTLQVPLLTGDRRLRELAAQENIPVHGTLWVLDELVRLRVITPVRASKALEEMLTHGTRLPQAECQNRLERWKGK